MVKRIHYDSLVRNLVHSLMACLWVAASAAAAEVEAQLDRDSVAAGNGALLTLKVSGSRAARPEMPEIENFIIEPRGQSQQMNIVNGRTSVSVTYQYAVGSNTPGDYRIPPIEVEVDGKKFSTQALKLKVLDSAAAKPPAGMPSGPAPPSPDADEGGKRFGFLTVEPQASDRKYVYVGEIAPVRIRAWFPVDARAQLSSGIQPEGKAFTLHNVSDRPEQTHEMRDGKRYLVVTWYGGISATKAGKYPASLSVNATVAVRDSSAPKPRRARSGPFSDPFFDSILDDMNAPMIQKDVTLKSDDQEIEVRPLPAEGRPEGFNGAVGEFKFDRTDISSEWKTGEPRQIGARISGSGNFALMNAPELSPADDWKIYPGKSDFTPGDNASFSGSKRFQFSAVPRKGGEQEVALKFSYFDPNRGAYVEITSPEKKIRIAGEDMAEEEPAAAPDDGPPVRRPEELVGQHLEISAPGLLVPLVLRTEFRNMLGVAGGLCALGGILAWLRLRWSDPQRRARAAIEKATQQAMDAAKRQAEAGDVSGFFNAARRAIQERLGGLWQQPAQAITLAEVTARIPGDSPVARFFREADLHEYGRQADVASLARWQSLLDETMASLQAQDQPR
jgi:hypothetical protein